jgi:hypothetical protein
MTQVMRERLYLREPHTDRLRKSAAARVRHLLATGWRETDRTYTPEYVAVLFQRPGQAPERIRPAPVAAPRPARQNARQGRQGPRAGR